MPIPNAPNALANFDSASGMLRALARFLHGHDHPALGIPGADWKEPALRLLGSTVNILPDKLQQTFYIYGGWYEAIPPGRLAELDAEEITRWAVRSYPKCRYPAVLIGSSNGALIHLASLMGIPWLPQSFLIPVRHAGHDANEPKQDMNWGCQHGPDLLNANPSLCLHHMHDPNQDQLMTRRMTYFRVKWQQLPEPYRQFLDECLEPDGTVILIECNLKWPTTRRADSEQPNVPQGSARKPESISVSESASSGSGGENAVGEDRTITTDRPLGAAPGLRPPGRLHRQDGHRVG